MLRRRRKSPREDKHAPRAPRAPQVGSTGSRRRARPDTPVPPELKLPPGGIPPAPPREKPKAEPRPDRRKPDRAAEKPPAAEGTAGKSPAPERVILVTGFDPFGGEQLNPSWEICKRLPREIAGLRVETCRVPCEFRRAIEVVAESIERHSPAIVISLGQAGGRTHMSVERVAINVNDARIDDNTGSRPIDEAIAPHGPAAYFATLPIKAMAAAMREAGAPAEVSNTAGTYVCNHLMYGVLHFLEGSGNAARAGFIHVPYAAEQVAAKPGLASLSIGTMVKGVQAAIEAAATNERDVALAEGKLD
jgi:pyroglutamyl-peptidase